MSAFETIIYEKVNGVAHVTLNRPEVMNRHNVQMRDDLYQALQAIKDDDDVVVAVFRGAGERAFCVGADLSEFGTAPPPVMAREVRFARDLWGLFPTLRQPLIAAVHGYALGSGVEVACFCDLRIASEDAVFGLPEVSLGMIPAGGGTQTVPRLIGVGRTLEMFLAGRRIDAREAHRIGLVNMVVTREQLYPTADELARRIASHGAVATRYAKEAVHRGMELALDEGLALERRLARMVAGKTREG
ncbi:MAG: enoyl-CoA hydratase/isomerase family protein [Chloroflexota bacterium]